MSPITLNFYGQRYTAVASPDDLKLLRIIWSAWLPEEVRISAYGWAVEQPDFQVNGTPYQARYFYVRILRDRQAYRMAVEQVGLLTEMYQLFWLAQRLEADGRTSRWEQIQGGIPWPAPDFYQINLHLRIGAAYAYHPN